MYVFMALMNNFEKWPIFSKSEKCHPCLLKYGLGFSYCTIARAITSKNQRIIRTGSLPLPIYQIQNYLLPFNKLYPIAFLKFFFFFFSKKVLPCRWPESYSNPRYSLIKIACHLSNRASRLRAYLKVRLESIIQVFTKWY